MPNQIPVITANAMKEAYLGYMTLHSVNMQYQTHSVSFPSIDLVKWMHELQELNLVDEFRFFAGVYAPPSPHAGRITVIIWPYKNGEPAIDTTHGNGGVEIEPYNDGTLNP
jgi:hypothetical protein